MIDLWIDCGELVNAMKDKNIPLPNLLSEVSSEIFAERNDYELAPTSTRDSTREYNDSVPAHRKQRAERRVLFEAVKELVINYYSSKLKFPSFKELWNMIEKASEHQHPVFDDITDDGDKTNLVWRDPDDNRRRSRETRKGTIENYLTEIKKEISKKHANDMEPKT